MIFTTGFMSQPDAKFRLTVTSLAFFLVRLSCWALSLQKLEIGGVILIPNPPIRRNSTEVHDKECMDSTAWITFSFQSLGALQH
jgi:hypothetical protein